jgi:hypothetical protein
MCRVSFLTKIGIIFLSYLWIIIIIILFFLSLQVNIIYYFAKDTIPTSRWEFLILTPKGPNVRMVDKPILVSVT